MKIEDLMIGDWVMRVDVEDPHPVMVTAVNSIKHYIRVLEPYTGRHDILLYAGSIEGIKTTLDVMEAFGFNYKPQAYSKQFGEMICHVFFDRRKTKKVMIMEDYISIFCDHSTQLHELQHMLRLAGLNLDELEYVLHFAVLELEARTHGQNNSTIDN